MPCFTWRSSGFTTRRARKASINVIRSISRNYMVKLHLGSGTNLLDGWRNMDIDGKGGAEYINLENRLPFASNSVDIILISHTLCLLNNKEQLVKEFGRVLKPGGWLRIIDNIERWYVGKPNNPDYHALPRQTLFDWLEGFDIWEVESDETQIDSSLIGDFVKAMADHTSFYLEAQKKLYG